MKGDPKWFHSSLARGHFLTAFCPLGRCQISARSSKSGPRCPCLRPISPDTNYRPFKLLFKDRPFIARPIFCLSRLNKYRCIETLINVATRGKKAICISLLSSKGFWRKRIVLLSFIECLVQRRVLSLVKWDKVRPDWTKCSYFNILKPLSTLACDLKFYV